MLSIVWLLQFCEETLHIPFLQSCVDLADMQALYPQTVSASFKRPAILPDGFTCSWQQAGPGGSEFVICPSSTGKAVITGQYAYGKAAVAKI